MKCSKRGEMLNGTADLRIVAYNIAADIYSEGITACATTGYRDGVGGNRQREC